MSLIFNFYNSLYWKYPEEQSNILELRRIIVSLEKATLSPLKDLQIRQENWLLGYIIVTPIKEDKSEGIG